MAITCCFSRPTGTWKWSVISLPNQAWTLTSWFKDRAWGKGRRVPNVLVIFSDQQHWRAMGCADPFFDTPGLDALAQESVFFERAFCSTPQCSPSRSSILTGFYPSTTGVWGNIGAAGGQASGAADNRA